MNHKAIIVSAPSGAGKSTMVNNLKKAFPQLEFSVSACSRPKRACEADGEDYFFLPIDEFKKKISGNGFVEWEEVYPGSFYGTLKSELNRIWSLNKIPIFDVDTVGGLNLKTYFGEKALAIFIQPPSLKVLKERLQNRGTESDESLKIRLERATYELRFAGKFDQVVVNNDQEEAVAQVTKLVKNFL